MKKTKSVSEAQDGSTYERFERFIKGADCRSKERDRQETAEYEKAKKAAKKMTPP